MHCLVIGKTGQLARALRAEASAAGATLTCLDRAQCDLSGDADQIQQAIKPYLGDAQAVIIAAAYTAVDAAESDANTAHAVNAVAPGAIATMAQAASIPVVYISTDYVFDGQAEEPYQPDDWAHPINVYGRTKLAGERAVLAAQPRSTILRTSWVYDGVGRNFLTTMLRLAETRDRLTVVSDQIGRPTYANDLARACLTAARTLLAGDSTSARVFHVTNTGPATSWAGFARTIFAATSDRRLHNVEVEDIASSAYPKAAERPAYSVLNTDRFERTFDFAMPDWQASLHQALNDIALKTDADDGL